MAGGSPRADFVGPRLRIARAFHGIDQAELAERLGVGRTLLGQIEVGARQPEPQLVAALAAELGFARAFFAAPLLDEVRDDECHGPRGPARRRAVAHAGLLAELVAWLDDRVQLPAEILPEEVSAADPEAIEAAAATCRRLWGLAPDLPIPNLTRVVERAGVVVARVDGAAPLARAGRRLLVVAGGGAAPRASAASPRFALARATGHVVLHRGADARPELDAEADHFAGALLLPREGLLRDLPRAPSLDGEALVQLASRWRVSLAALVRRAAELPVANAARYRDAVPHLTARDDVEGAGTSPDAPDSPSPPNSDEPPEVLALALHALDELSRGRRVQRSEVARRLGWTPAILAAVTGLAGGEEHGSRVVSLAAWKARRAAASQRGAPESAPRRSSGAQLELDFEP